MESYELLDLLGKKWLRGPYGGFQSAAQIEFLIWSEDPVIWQCEISYSVGMDPQYLVYINKTTTFFTFFLFKWILG